MISFIEESIYKFNNVADNCHSVSPYIRQLVQEQRELQQTKCDDDSTLQVNTEVEQTPIEDSDGHFGEFQSCPVENSEHSDNTVESIHSKSVDKNIKNICEEEVSSERSKACYECEANGTDEQKDKKDSGKTKQPTKEERLG